MDSWKPIEQFVGRAGLWLACCVAIVALGCQREVDSVNTPSSAPVPLNTVAPKPVRLLVVADPKFATVAERQWSARSDAPIEILQWTEDEFHSFLANTKSEPKQVAPADAVIYPANLMGEMADSQCITAFPDYVSRGNFAANDYAENDIFPLVRNAVARWGEQQFAVSSGQPLLVLGYRSDILDAVQVNPPETWSELSEIVAQIEKFDFSDKPKLKTDFVLAQPLNSRWAAELLLARSAPAAKNRARFSTLFDLRSMKAQIGTIPFVDSLEAIVNDQAYGSDQAKNWGPCDSMRALREGRCAMAIGWLCPLNLESEDVPTELESEDQTTSNAPQVSIQVMQLPGSRRVFSVAGNEWRDVEGDEIQRVTYLPTAGRCGSVFRQSRRQRAAWGLLVRLTGQEWGHTVCSVGESSAIFRESQRAQTARWTGSGWPAEVARSYGDAVRDSLSQPMWISSPRLNSGAAYRTALSTAVQKALNESMTPSAALDEAVQAWTRITGESDPSILSDSYHRSLGLIP